MRKKYAPEHVMIRDGIYYYVRHISHDLAPIYSVTRLCFSLKTKSLKAAIRTSKSVTQRLEDYWLGLRLQNMDIPAIQVVRTSDDTNDATLYLSEACELYLRLKGVDKDKVFIRTAKRNTQYVIGLLDDMPIASYSSSDAATFRNWLISLDMSIKTVKRVFSSIRAIVNLAIAEEGLDCSNAFAKTYFPEDGKAQSR